MTGELRDHVDRRLGEVGTRLTMAAGGQALCRLGAHATSAKELEGRMAVLMELRRSLRREPDLATAQIASRWRTDLAQRRAKGDPSPWVAYLAGGVAEIENLPTQPRAPGVPYGGPRIRRS